MMGMTEKWNSVYAFCFSIDLVRQCLVDGYPLVPQGYMVWNVGQVW